MRLMAVDYGEKRVGIASTDESGEFAIPRAVYPNDLELIDKVCDFVEKEKIEAVVIGDSKNFKGEPNLVMKGVEAFKSVLENRGVKTILHTEILTTMEARQIQGQTDMTDASAAALILKSYIDSQIDS
ncbi:MAG: RuvX/YqgF family protein [Candidatus Colwellbacteria bacterium]|nr:RuvX/YqgF family protein [Candidatus Colwellbacteria bacterium]